jgi:hypothetical protein
MGLSGASQKSRALPKRCRAFQRRTLDVLSRAYRSWRAIYEVGDELPLPRGGGSCNVFAGRVKKFLAKEVSGDPESQMGFQSIKKLLPGSCSCMERGLLSDLASRLGEPGRPLPKGYLSFVKKEVSRLFPKGWDSSYERHCLLTSPPLASCVGGPRLKGGSLGALAVGQSEYLEFVLRGRGMDLPAFDGELLVVQSAGKPRPLSKFPAESLVLKPLHKTIYGNLSRFRWLLKGPPREEVLSRAGFREGCGSLVSGDYRSATDNLPVEVMETALKVALDNASFIPTPVKEYAMEACRPYLFERGRERDGFEVSTGQMMGSLLSFPFLCLQNRLAFVWACREAGLKAGRVPCLINGDDILFQADATFACKWREVVGRLGLEVEPTKTSVEKTWGTINSTLLRWDSSGRLGVAWSPRFGMFRPAESPTALGKSYLDFLNGLVGPKRFLAGREWFKWHVVELRSASVPLPSLGLRGRLAYRLARLFGLIDVPVGEFPPPPRSHEVGLPRDSVSEVPTSAVDEELALESALEISSRKWAEGWKPLCRTAEAVRWCIARSALTKRRYVPSDTCFATLSFASAPEFAFRLRNGFREERLSRVERAKPFFAPLPSKSTTFLINSLIEDLSFDFGRGDLPSYEEACCTPEL